jgi:hypothetical protein
MNNKSLLKDPLFIGCGWQEYLKMFNLEEIIKDGSIQNMKILDCAAGASTVMQRFRGSGEIGTG